MEFEDRNIVVTGAAGGMGFAIAESLVSAGAYVRMLDKRSLTALPQGRGKAEFFQGDLLDWEFVRSAVGDMAPLHGLVNTAGILLFGKDQGVAEIDLDIWDKVMAVNLKSMVMTCKAALPNMKTPEGGAIVNFSTIQCLRGDEKPQDAYQASKAGVIALTKSIAIQYASDGIRANSILPGPTETPMQERWQEQEILKERTAKNIPLRRVGTAADMAATCLFLLSDKASFITGTELIVDGGITALP